MGTVLSPLGYYASSFGHLLAGNSLVKMDPNAALAQQLKGKVIHVDMTSSFDHWPSGARHPDYERLVRETDDMLERLVCLSSFLLLVRPFFAASRPNLVSTTASFISCQTSQTHAKLTSL